MRKELVARLVKHMLTQELHEEGYEASKWKTMCPLAMNWDATQEEFDLAWTLAKLKS